MEGMYVLYKKVGFISLGCPKNNIDSELMMGILKENGYELTNEACEAEVLIVNTCGFIDEAKQESIDCILEMAEFKKNNCKKLVVAGCLAERYKEDIINEMPEVDVVIGSGHLSEIIESIKQSEKVVLCGNINGEYSEQVERLIDLNKTYAYLKIAEGCNNCCSYCVIPSIKGNYRSRKIDAIITEAKAIVENGIKEIILVAQDVTKYGKDLYGEKSLVKLLRELSKIDSLKWIRLLYCYPDEIDNELIDEIEKNNKIIKYIDMPIQHCNNMILSAMGRGGKKEDIIKVIEKIREKVPEIVFRTSIIAGFPGETNIQHKELCSFISELKFEKLGVFKYSKEEGTKASKMDGQIEEEIKDERCFELMEIQNKISAKYLKKREGKVYCCVVEGVAEDGIFYYGRSYGEAPEVDGNIYFTSSDELKLGEYVDVKILNSEDYDLIGEVL